MYALKDLLPQIISKWLRNCINQDIKKSYYEIKNI